MAQTEFIPNGKNEPAKETQPMWAVREAGAAMKNETRTLKELRAEARTAVKAVADKALDGISTESRSLAQNVGGFVRKNPVISVLSVFAAGYAIANVMSFRRHSARLSKKEQL